MTSQQAENQKQPHISLQRDPKESDLFQLRIQLKNHLVCFHRRAAHSGVNLLIITLVHRS